MKLRALRLSSSLMIATPLSLLNPALASGASLLSDNIELSSQAPNVNEQTPQNYLWGDNPLSSSPPPSVAPDTVLVADRSDLDNPHASCANNEDGTKSQKLRIRNDDSCTTDGGVTNWMKLPGWATPWKTKNDAAVEEQDEYESCMGVSTPVGMALPYHLCCLGIVHAYVNGLADRISKCLFDFAKCETFTMFNQDVCCQTFYLEVGSEYATGVNCLPRI